MRRGGRRREHRKILIIGGLDPTAEAGVLRDVTTCQDFGREPVVFVTALTAQDNKHYFGAHVPSRACLRQQWRAVVNADIGAVKIGMLGDAQVVRVVAVGLSRLKRQNPRLKVVWDPVLKSSSGGVLLDKQGFKLAVRRLLPLTDVVTPNGPEMLRLIAPRSRRLSPETACRQFFAAFARPVYLKGGHLAGRSRDYYFDGHRLTKFSGPSSRLKFRGTGCRFATAVACALAHGRTLRGSLGSAKRYINAVFAGKAR